MNNILRIFSYSLIGLTLMVVLVYFTNEDWYHIMIQEDGLVEYLTAFILLVISLLVFVKVLKIKTSRGYAWLMFNLLMALGLFFGFGEEISWGQRIFNIESSDYFLENNLQKETNIHNLIVGDVKLNKWVFTYGLAIVFSVYFFLSLLLYQKNSLIKQLVDNLGIPIPKLMYSILFVSLSLVIFLIADDKKWELWECYFATMLLMIFLDPFNSKEKLTV